MVKGAQKTMVGAAVILSMIGWSSRSGASEQPDAPVSTTSIGGILARVRPLSPRVSAAVIDAAAQSKTFRGLIEQINTTDGIVYIVDGDCGQRAVHACLKWVMTPAGSHRVLRILIDNRQTDREAMGSIGHELQHAVEVLSDPTVRTPSQMYLLYRRLCPQCGLLFETEAAVRAGDAVRGE